MMGDEDPSDIQASEDDYKVLRAKGEQLVRENPNIKK
jgi:hypothetical protein